MGLTTVEFQVFGDYALFTDPITRVGGEKCSYSVPTYEALKNIAKSIYWKPTFIWYVDDVRVMNPIRMYSMGVTPIHYQNEKNDLSYYTYLSDVMYQVRAHFEWNMNRPEMAADRLVDKHMEIATGALERGGRRDVYLGTRECQAFVEPCVFGEGKGYYDSLSEKDFGLMLHGLTYADEAYSPETEGMLTVNMWRPVMENGVIHFIRPDECTVCKPIHKMDIKDFMKKPVLKTVRKGV